MIAVPKPVRSPAHLAFIRSLPCCVSGRTWGVEAAHVGMRGMGQKCSDLETIPLNSIYHKEQHRIGLKAFARTYELDVPSLLVILSQKPHICVVRWREDWRFVADYAGEVIPLDLASVDIRHSLQALKDHVRVVLTEEILKRVNEWKAK